MSSADAPPPPGAHLPSLHVRDDGDWRPWRTDADERLPVRVVCSCGWEAAPVGSGETAAALDAFEGGHRAAFFPPFRPAEHGLPEVGARARLRVGRALVEAVVVQYLDSSPYRTGVTEVLVDAGPDSGVYPLSAISRS